MEPELLLLDEPMAGMEHQEGLCAATSSISSKHFVPPRADPEHDMGVVMDLSDRVVVLEYWTQRS